MTAPEKVFDDAQTAAPCKEEFFCEKDETSLLFGRFDQMQQR